MDRNARERWRRIESLLDGALDSNDSLTPESESDPAIRAEAGRLLGRRDRVAGFLERPALEWARDLFTTPATDSAPRYIGPWRILREAGRGGMATVYVAERDDPQLRHRVAIKVLREGIGDSQALRFVRERQILLSFEHPSIARLLDGGVTEDGLPWFAMEYVDGVPITRYCEDHRLEVRARLALFLQVCDAVQYAHRKLVIHRDIKPSNLLVTGEEDDAVVKLLDFGIARSLELDPGDGAELTRAGLIPLTPEYASPEQLRGESVSTASDIYQLGVLLYELLSGHRPHRLGGLPLHEIHRVVCETDVAPPSSVVPARDARRLRGDLDDIAGMALRPDADRRYASVDRLAADIRRHLADEPVEARPDTLMYRTGRFIRRHRIGVASATAIFLLLASFAAAMTIQRVRIAHERDRAEQATAFLADLFQVFEPIETRAVVVPVADVLARGVERARSELADQPVLRATILETIAEVYEVRGLHEEAEPLLEEALATQSAELGADHLDVGASLHRMASLAYERGRYAQAESRYREALVIFRRRLDAGALGRIQAESGLALVLRARGDYTTADSLLREVMSAPLVNADSSVDAPITLMFLGKLRTRSGDYEEAERLLRESLDRRLALMGREHPAVANSFDALGELMLARGDTDAAESFFLEALSIRDAIYDEDHTDIASGLTYLARAHLDRADAASADTLLRRALPIFRRAFGDESPDVADALEHLAAVHVVRGELDAADTLLHDALAIWRGMPLEPTHDRPATLLLRIGALRMRQDRHEEARSLLEEGLALRQRSLPPAHWLVGEAMSLLGACLSMQGRFEEAERLLVAGHRAVAAVRAEDDRITRDALERIREHRARTESLRERLVPRARRDLPEVSIGIGEVAVRATPRRALRGPDDGTSGGLRFGEHLRDAVLRADDVRQRESGEATVLR
jgi:serine/threonine-protein kinase